MTSLLLATAVIVGILSLISLTGLLVALALAGRRAWTTDDWIDAPFLGMAAIAVVLQNGVYFGLPLGTTCWPFIAVVVLTLMIAAWRQRLRGLWEACPATVFGLALGVLVIHGIGLWLVGVHAYTGRGWGDQINYDIVAQYLTEAVNIGTPRLSDPVALIGSMRSYPRMGQSIIHGFFSTVFRLGTKPLFEPTILLSPWLASLALFSHGVRARLPVRVTYLMAAAAALLPAIASVHLESFLSHALALPCLLYVPVMLDRATERGSWGDYARVGLVLSATTAIYLEFFFLLEACVLVFLLVAMFDRDRRWRICVGLAIVGMMPAIVGATRGLVGMLEYLDKRVLGSIYPWALTLEGVERLWAGDLVGAWWSATAPIARVLAVGLVLAGYAGLFRHLGVEIAKRTADPFRRGSGTSRALCTLGLALVPVLVIVRDSEHAYQFYKLAMTMAPLLCFGAVYWAWSSLARANEQTRNLIVGAGTAAIGIVAACGTFTMGMTSAKPGDHPRQSSKVTLDSGFLGVQKWLDETSDRDVVLCVSDDVTEGFANGWFALLGHRNRMWMLNPYVNDNQLLDLVGADYLQELSRSVVKPTILTSKGRAAIWAHGSEALAGRDLGSYRLVQPPYDRAAVLCAPSLVINHERTGMAAIPPAGVDFVIYSSVAGPATVSFRVAADDPAYRDGRMRINDDEESMPVPWDMAGIVAVPVHLTRGVTRANIKAPLRRDGTPVVALDTTLTLAESALPVFVLSNPNGLETVEGRPFVWLGAGKAAIAIFSPVMGVCAFTMDTLLGPSIQHTTLRRLRVSLGAATVGVETRGTVVTVNLPVSAGWTRVDVEALDTPDTKLPGDPRPLVVGVREVGAHLVPAKLKE